MESIIRESKLFPDAKKTLKRVYCPVNMWFDQDEIATGCFFGHEQHTQKRPSQN